MNKYSKNKMKYPNLNFGLLKSKSNLFVYVINIENIKPINIISRVKFSEKIIQMRV